jgi:multiple sugar transport system substrate-binding protein
MINNRKNLFKVAGLVACMAVLLIAVFNNSNRQQRLYPERQAVRFWHTFRGKWQIIVENIVREFNDSQNKYEVIPLCVSDGNTKFLLAVAGGSPPDLMTQWNPVIPNWANKKIIIPFDELMSKVEMKKFRSKLYKPSLQIGSYKNKLYGLCVGLNAYALYYRPEHLKEAGLNEDFYPLSINELTKTADKLTLHDNKGRIIRLGMLPSYTLRWLPSFGGSFLKNGKLAIGTNEQIKLWQWFASFTRKYGLSKIAKFRAATQSNSCGGLGWPFITGAYSIALDGQWRVQQLAKYAPGIKYATCPVPPFAPQKTEQKNAGYVNGNFMIIPVGGKCPQGALAFSKFWAGLPNPEKVAKCYIQGGWIPPVPAIVKTQIYQKYLEKHPQMKTFVNLVEKGNLQVAPNLPEQDFIIDRIKAKASKVIRGSVSAKQGWCELKDEIEYEIPGIFQLNNEGAADQCQQ